MRINEGFIAFIGLFFIAIPTFSLLAVINHPISNLPQGIMLWFFGAMIMLHAATTGQDKTKKQHKKA